jgi:UDP-N-acetylglucosamine:LPS N-acetylglucosamine transferase
MKVLAIASIGGHWIQLLRVTLAFKDMEVVFVSTKESFSSTVADHKFYAVPDASRWDKFKLFSTFWQVFKVVRAERPAAIITTGAAPGLMGLIAGKICRTKTIWVDSIANVDEISLSGRIALKFADKVYTQWPDLATSKIVYAGNVLS